MRQKQEMPILQLTPATGVAFAKLHKINGPIEFGAPAQDLHLAHTRINLNERSGAQQRIKG